MKPLVKLVILVAAAGFLVQVAAPKPADAIPAFARKHATVCSTCHSAWPQLNATGRTFKENGYRFSFDEEPESMLSGLLEWDKNFPISARVIARPFDKREGVDEKIRAIHEIEVLVAGYIGKNFSAFFELEAEDENDFEPEVFGYLTYHASPFFNVQFFYEEFFKADPFDTLSGSRRQTRGRNAVIDQRFGGADNNGRLRDPRQGIAIYGRPIDQVFYTVGYTGVAKDAEGVNASNIHGRLAVSVIPELTIGTFGVVGECEVGASNCEVKRDFSRWGFDAQAEFNDFVFTGAYLKAQDDLNALNQAGGIDEVENDAFYVQGQYVFRRDDGSPMIVPLVRFDRYERNNGSEKFSEIVLNLNYFITENARIYVEWFKQVDVPSGQSKGGRVTIQGAIVF